MSPQLQIDGGEFYHLKINEAEALFTSQEAAIEHLRENKEKIDLGDPDVQLAQVRTGEEWSIEGLPWQNIALQLL